jgi:fused signal recognition particle receptor
MFNFLKKKLSRIYESVTNSLGQLFGRETIDKDTLEELKKILLNADTGVKTTNHIIENLTKRVESGSIDKGQDLKDALEQELISLLDSHTYKHNADIFLLVGINGSGKTTFTGKLGHYFKAQGKKVLYVAADTFRAAATEQLEQWGNRLDIDVIKGTDNQDPASVVYQGCQKYIDDNYDILIIDTAGRLQNKVNLMNELSKMKKIIHKKLSDKHISTLLTVDAMLGQNSFNQAQVFNESTDVDGIVLTKLDGTGKGGIVFSISQELSIPVAFISYGEQPENIKLFNPHEYVSELISHK